MKFDNSLTTMMKAQKTIERSLSDDINKEKIDEMFEIAKHLLQKPVFMTPYELGRQTGTLIMYRTYEGNYLKAKLISVFTAKNPVGLTNVLIKTRKSIGEMINIAQIIYVWPKFNSDGR